MKRQFAFSKTSSPHSQRGIATILIVVLIGVALTATAMSIMHSTRSTQEKHIAVHATTNAQVGAWAGVEAFRRYLDAHGVGGLADNGSYEIEIQDYGTADDSMVAKDIKIIPAGTGHRVEATIVNVQKAAHASAAVGVVYEVMPAGGTDYQLSGPLNFNDDLKLTSRLVFDNPTSINVKGNVDISADVTNLDGVNSTGSVTVSSAIDMGLIHTNGDVNLGGATGVSASATEIKSRGKVTLTGGASSPLISANGDILHNAHTNTISMRSRSDVTVGSNSGNHALIVAGGGVTINSGYGGTVTNLHSVDTIRNNSSSAGLTNIYGENDLNCLSSWNKFTTISINGDFGSGCTSPTTPTVGQTVNQPAGITVNVMNPVPEFGMPSLAVDVYPYREEANYAVSYEAGKIKVVINNVKGLANGAYYLGLMEKHKVDNIEYEGYGLICPTLDATGKCPAGTAKRMCFGYSENEGCISYISKSFTVADDTNGTISYQTLPSGAHASKGTFLIGGTGITPGIWWIDGNVVFGNGYNNATVLATGNIATSNHYRGAAVNYGGEPVVYSHTIRDSAQRTTPYQEICEVIGTGLKSEWDRSADYIKYFKDQYPTNLCDKDSGIYTPHPLGNIALAAGGVRPAALGGDATTYSGGDISIKGNSNVFGIVMAGGYLVVRNNAAIMGYIAAAVQGSLRTGSLKNKSDGDIKIYTDSATEWYSPNEVPWMGTDPCTVGCGSGGTGGAKVLWSRYL